MPLPTLQQSGKLRLEPTQKWIRATLQGETVIDSKRAMLVRVEQPPIPRSYAFPPEDVSDAVPEAARLEVDGHIAIEWDAMEHWYEESEEVFVHPRDPHSRIDAILSSRHVVIEKDGTRLAESRRSVLLFEGPLPVRYYLLHDDVQMRLLRRGKKTTQCPYKGHALHYDARIGDDWEEALAWSYEAPLREVEPIRGRIAFYNEKVEIKLDGEAQSRPRTPFS